MTLSLSHSISVIRGQAGGGLPDPPEGFAYLTDDEGVYITDSEGSYIIVPIDEE